MDALEAMRTRRSIRAYTEEPVSDEAVEVLLRAAMAAPSAGNQRPWRFIVLRDEGVKQRVAEASPYARMLPAAPVGIVVCGDPSVQRHEGYWVQDCSAAVQNLLLAAHGIGLGAVWLGYHPREERERGCAEALGLPAGIVPFAVIAVGHPAEQKPPVDRFEPSFVHRDRW